jgi:hypothetical protein
MENAIISVVGCLLFCASVQSQELPRELKGGGHLLGETAEQFFSIGSVGELIWGIDERVRSERLEDCETFGENRRP